MRKSGIRCLALVIVAGVALPAIASGSETVGFDDIDASLADIPIVSPYQGLTWANITAYTAVSGFEGFNNGIVSGPNAGYSGGETAGSSLSPIVGSVTALAGQNFDFLSGWFGSGYYDNLSLTVLGSYQGALVASRVVTLATTGAALFTFGFTGIDTLTFSAARTPGSTDPFLCGSFNCTQFTFDDAAFVIHDVGTTPTLDVPEPASLALVGAGLCAMVAGRRAIRRRRPPDA